MARKDLETRLIATDNASKVIDKVADKLEDLEKQGGAAIEISVDDKASPDLRTISERLAGLSKEDQKIVLTAAVASAEKDIARILRSLERVEEMDDEEVQIRVDALGNARERLDQVQRELADLDGETAQVKVEARGLDEILTKLGNLPGSLGNLGGALGGLSAGGGAVAGAGAIAAGLVASADAAADLAVEAGTYAQLTGASVEDASRLLTVLKSTGLEYNDIADITVQVNQALQQQPDLAARLGININDGRNALERLVQVMGLAERGLISMNDQSTLFGEEGIRQMAKVQLSIEDIARALLDIPEGAIVTDADVEKAVEMQREMQEVLLKFQAIATELGQNIVPYLTDALELAGQLDQVFGQVNFDLPDVGGFDMGSAFDWLNPVRNSFRLVGEGWKQLNGEGDELKGTFVDTGEAATDVVDPLVAITDATEDFVKANKPMSDLPKTWRTVMEAVNRVRHGLEPTKDQMQAVLVLTQQYGIDTREVFNRAATVIDDHNQKIADGVNQADGLVTVIKDMYKEWADAKTAADLILSQGPTVESAVTGAQKYQERMFGLKRIAAQSESAFDAVNKALEENGDTFDLATEEGRANQAVLEQLAESLIPGVASAFADADGDLEKFRSNMDGLRDKTFAGLDEATGLTDEQIGDLLERLGTFDGADYEAQFNLLGMEDAESKLALLLPMLDELNLRPDTEHAVSLAILAGDPEAALQAIQDDVDSQPPPKVTLEIAWSKVDKEAVARAAAGLFQDAGGTTGPYGGVAGERGPEILNSRYLAVGPTWVPPGTRVTSRVRTARILRSRGHRGLRRYDQGGIVPAGPINVNISTGFIGNTYDMMNIVNDSMRRAARLLPKNP